LKESPKQIWLPKSELNVRVNGHTVEMWEHMVMEPQPISQHVGFGNTDQGFLRQAPSSTPQALVSLSGSRPS